jgi:hypothetical protein
VTLIWAGAWRVHLVGSILLLPRGYVVAITSTWPWLRQRHRGGGVLVVVVASGVVDPYFQVKT